MRILLDNDLWALVASIATTIGVLVVVISAFIAIRTLKEMRNARYLEAMLRVYELIGSKEMHKARRYIHNKFPLEPEAISDEKMEEAKEAADQISTTFDRVATLVIHGLVPRRFLLDSHHAIFFRMWDKLEKHIEHRRKSEQSPFHVKNFQAWAKECREYHEKNNLVRIKSIDVLRDLLVHLKFSDGTQRDIDLEPYLYGLDFDPIRNDPGMFRSIRVDKRKGTLVWDNCAEIEPHVLYYELKPVQGEAEQESDEK